MAASIKFHIKRTDTLTIFLICLSLSCLFRPVCLVETAKGEQNKKPDSEKWKKKDIRDYTDADLERLYDQWEESDDDPLEPDELPEWKKPPPKVDMSKLDPSDPEKLLKESKKGQSLMIFVSVSGNPTTKESEKITSLWQSSLFNANIDVQRYVTSPDRVIFMVKDGAMAWEVKDFLVRQARCKEVTIEGKNYPGAAATEDRRQKTDL